MSQCHSVTASQCHTLSQCHIVTVSQCVSVTTCKYWIINNATVGQPTSPALQWSLVSLTSQCIKWFPFQFDSTPPLIIFLFLLLDLTTSWHDYWSSNEPFQLLIRQSSNAGPARISLLLAVLMETLFDIVM